MYELTAKEKEALLIRRRPMYAVVKKGEIELPKTGYTSIHITSEEQDLHCWCKLNHGEKVKGKTCRYCGRSAFTYHTVHPKSIIKEYEAIIKKEKYSRWRCGTHSDTSTLDNFFYVKKHPEKENALLIFKIAISVKAGKTFEDKEEIVFKIDRIIEIIPNEYSRSFKYSRGKEVDIDMFDAFQLSSKLLRDGIDIEYEDSTGLIDFMLKHKKIGQYTGFLECFNMVDIPLQRNAFFMFYMYLYAQYPVIEFIVKMGYIKLVSDIMKNLANGCNKESIRAEAQKLTKILNNEATKGSMALTVPKYIADDLNYKEAGFTEYITWGDVCQMNPEGTISKENYERIVQDDDYYEAMRCGVFASIPNVMKFGYSYDDVIKYLNKQKKENLNWRNAFTFLQDYLNMCDLMQIEFEKFPKNIESAHNNVQSAFRAKKDEMNDKAITKIADYVQKYLPQNKEYLESDYVIILPKRVVDIIQEGQAMHNCVGSYIQKVVNKRSLIFFIRKKDDPEHSFITAEYAYNRLNQIFYKNNRSVSDKEILDIAKNFCDRLKKDASILN